MDVTDAAAPGGAALDLTPAPPPPRARRGRGAFSAALLVVVLGALGFVLLRGLGDATVFFYNADEAVARRGDLADKRFRLQGTVVDGSVVDDAAGVSFLVEHNGVRAAVRHRGDPPDLFQSGIPVVAEGRWQGDTFASERVLVKHSEVYQEQHPERIEEPGPPDEATGP
ncbi:MAG: cytochrome c maturation protein CcmE [Acidimicrobiales bacterium]